MSGLAQRIVLAPDDGSLGPLLRIADDRLAPRAGYGRHEHRSVDVVAVVLTGSLRHRWGDGADLVAGDVGVLRAGAGLEHDEVAGAGGARVLQCYLRSADAGASPAHEVHHGASGWVDLRRPDARLWLGTPADEVPAGVVLAVRDDGVVLGGDVTGAAVVVSWQVDAGRPAWAG